MPKQTFFNLPEVKQQILIDSLKEEFSRVPLHEASIANIVHRAQIPRGSFYQYFTDKEDAYYFLLEQLTKKNQKKIILYLNQFNGDIFETFIQIFEDMLRDFQAKENRDFFRNTFLNMNYKIESKFIPDFYEEDYLSEISSLINIQMLNLSDEKHLFHVLKIIMAVTFQNTVQNFVCKVPKEEAIRIYMLEMDLLKKGLYRAEYKD